MKPTAAFALSLILALPGAAATAAPATVRTVPHADLDLRRPEDTQRMLRRIEAAALAACGADALSLAPVRRAVRSSACWADAVAEAVASLNAPALTAAFAAARPPRDPPAPALGN